MRTLALDRKAALIELYQARTALTSLKCTNHTSSTFNFQAQFLSGILDFLSCAELSSKHDLSEKKGLKCANEFERLQKYFTELCCCHFGVDKKSRKYLSHISYFAYLCKRALAHQFNLNM